MASVWNIKISKKSNEVWIMALFFEKRQDAQVYFHCQQLSEAAELILSPSTSKDKRMEATMVRISWKFTSFVVYISFISRRQAFGVCMSPSGRPSPSWRDFACYFKSLLKLFCLHERWASPPRQNLAIDYLISQQGGLEFSHINAARRAGHPSKAEWKFHDVHNTQVTQGLIFFMKRQSKNWP